MQHNLFNIEQSFGAKIKLNHANREILFWRDRGFFIDRNKTFIASLLAKPRREANRPE
jgi:hypothetical protein